MIINKVEIPWNMEYIFNSADIKLDDQKAELLKAKYIRAHKLAKHNGALLLGLVSAAANWLSYAYAHNLPVNSKAYEKCIRDLDDVHIPNKIYE